jgi:hypothetical protein
MQRESTSKSAKAPPGATSSNKMTLESASVWGTSTKHAQRSDTPAPTWSRYVDSRLKQFCTR